MKDLRGEQADVALAPRARATSRSRGARRTVGVVAVVAIVLGSCTTTLSREELATEYYNIGSAYFDLGELEKSSTYLTRAIELSPELSRGSYNLARVYVLQERYDEALALLDRLLAEDPDNSLVLETIAYAHYEAGDLEQASDWYGRAEAVNPTDPQLLRNRAAVALELGDAQTALATLRRALELDEDDPDLSLALARAERQAGNATAAREAYARYLELTAEPAADALLEYAAVLEEQEYYADAIEVLARAAEGAGVQPADQALSHFLRGRLLLTEAEEAEGGLDAVRTAITLGFDDADAFARLLAHPDLVGRAELEELGVDAGLLETDDDSAEAVPPGNPDGEDVSVPPPEGSGGDGSADETGDGG